MTKIDPGKVPQRKLFTGALMPAVGMGTFGSDHVSAQEVSQAVAGAVEAGYRSFDCAACYGNEAQIGQVFADAFARGTVKREELFIASKVWNDMHGDGDVLIACARTLKDLKLDYLDMYYVHWPFPNYHAPGCDVDSRNPDARPFSVEEFMKTWRQMERLVDMGLTRHIGMSNMTIKKLEQVLPLCRIRPAVICIKWAVQRGQTPIPFSTKEKNYTANLRCVTEDPLTEEEMDIIRGLDRNNRLIKGQVFLWEGASGWEDLWDMDVK